MSNKEKWVISLLTLIGGITGVILMLFGEYEKTPDSIVFLAGAMILLISLFWCNGYLAGRNKKEK